ncbi:hypothetical protein J6590_077511 [Homalodisca vitripennis]|nr:hypothetical protein J6590_077511 [Homalodisca vitripennis]
MSVRAGLAYCSRVLCAKQDCHRLDPHADCHRLDPHAVSQYLAPYCVHAKLKEHQYRWEDKLKYVVGRMQEGDVSESRSSLLFPGTVCEVGPPSP